MLSISRYLNSVIFVHEKQKQLFSSRYLLRIGKESIKFFN